MQILRGEALQEYNTLALQAQATALVRVTSDAQLLAAFRWANDRELPVIPLGEGSNVVISGDLDALVVCQDTRGIAVLEDSGDTVSVRVSAGENWHELVQWSLQQGLCGLENLALIPGTVGAAPIQNVGAYGVELRSYLLRVHALNIADGQPLSLDNSDCEFGYRDSVFKNSLRDKLVITAVDLQLTREPQVRIDYPVLKQFFAKNDARVIAPQDVFDAVIEIRRSKLPDPVVEPNAGSFFKNPVLCAARASELSARYPALPSFPQADGTVKFSAGWMIDSCGWKGYREHGLGVHPEHALVIVNYGSDDGRSLLALASEIATTVAEAFAIDLSIEPRVYG